MDLLLQATRVGRLERPRAAHHLVQQHADGPQIRLRVDVAGVEALGRQIRDAAEVVARDFSAERQRLGDPEVEDLDLIARQDSDVARLEIAVQERSQLAAIDRDLERVGRLQEIAQLHRDPRSPAASGIGPAAITSERFCPSRYSIAI